MARRKDHSPEQLKSLIHTAAERLIANKGLGSLTARALADEIGYTPGTLYNVYQDMDALIIDVNFNTLGKLYAFCQQRLANTPQDFQRVSALAYAYVDFAHANILIWECLFAGTRKGEAKQQLPDYYQKRLLDIFNLIEATLHDCLKMPAPNAHASARLLWACLHGITVLTLDGRLNLVGVEQPHTMIDTLLASVR